MDKVSLGGRCWECDFFIDNQCRKAGNILSQQADPICLAKLQVILLQDLCEMMSEYLFEDNDGE